MPKQKRTQLPLIFTLLILALLLYFYAEKWLRALLLYLSNAAWARQTVTAFPPAWYVASRFVAGETIEDAIRVARELNAKGMKVTMDYLGESITDPAAARAARDEIIELLSDIYEQKVEASVSVKLSQLGVKIDEELALRNMHRIMQCADQTHNFVRIDMEESTLVDTTFDVYRTLRQEGFDNVGVVIQAYLYRSEFDVRRLIDSGSSVRLCKGAYMEPPEIAFTDKEDTDRNYVHLMEMLLSQEARNHGVYPAIATHDEDMIQATIACARAQEIPRNTFEFQLLYGVRRELQEQLVEDGYRVRIYVPYGTAWYPYFMRRLAERPANLWFFISNFFRR